MMLAGKKDCFRSCVIFFLLLGFRRCTSANEGTRKKAALVGRVRKRMVLRAS